MGTKELEVYAAAKAFDIHIADKRKYTGEHYIVHPRRVVELVKSVPHTKTMICAAWLHDTVEDHPDMITLKEIEIEFGEDVATLV